MEIALTGLALALAFTSTVTGTHCYFHCHSLPCTGTHWPGTGTHYRIGGLRWRKHSLVLALTGTSTHWVRLDKLIVLIINI